MSQDVLLTLFSCRFRTAWKHLEPCGWAMNATKVTFLKEWAWCLLRGLQVLNKNPTGMELEAFLQSQRADGGLDLAMEYKGTPPVVGGFSSPMRARVDCHKSSRWYLALSFAMCWGCNCYVVASTVVAKCGFKIHCYLPREYCRRWTVSRLWGKRPWRLECGEMNKMA